MSSELIASLFSTPEMDARTSDRAWLQGMLDFEAALARVQSRLGIIPPDCGEAITAACRVELLPVEQLAAAALAGGNPAIPLVRELSRHVEGDAAAFVHWGATSQDAVDTGTMLVLRSALHDILAELEQLEAACAERAGEHRHTVMAGRTLLQHALPVTFGVKAAGWLSQLHRSRTGLDRILQQELTVQLGGAVGTLASLYDRGLDVLQGLCSELDLAEPDLPWHTARDRIVRIIAELGLLGGALDRIALDVSLLMQTELGEAAEPAAPGKGGSSTMPHKRNPVGCALTRAAVRQLHGLMSTAYTCMAQEHERGAGGWHAEWDTLFHALKLTAAALRQTRLMVEGLSVDPTAMRANLERTNGLIMAEAVMLALAPSLGRGQAHALVGRACTEATQEGISLKAVLARNTELVERLGADRFHTLFDPAAYLGMADAFVDRALGAAGRRN